MSGMSEAEPQDARIEEQRRRVAWHSAFLRGDLGQILRALYAHEINVGMQSFWDGGWDVWFGDDMNGRRTAEHFDPDSFDEIADWLKRTAEDYYPALKKGRVAVMDSYG